MLMMIRARKYTIYEKIALGDRIPLSTAWSNEIHTISAWKYSTLDVENCDRQTEEVTKLDSEELNAF